MYSVQDTEQAQWVSPFGHRGINACVPTPPRFSQAPTSFIASDCQGIHRVHLITWPYNTNGCFWSPKRLSLLNRIQAMFQFIQNNKPFTSTTKSGLNFTTVFTLTFAQSCDRTNYLLAVCFSVFKVQYTICPSKTFECFHNDYTGQACLIYSFTYLSNNRLAATTQSTSNSVFQSLLLKCNVTTLIFLLFKELLV